MSEREAKTKDGSTPRGDRGRGIATRMAGRRAREGLQRETRVVSGSSSNSVATTSDFFHDTYRSNS